MSTATYENWDTEVSEGSSFEPREVPPDGAIPARVCAIVGVGTHDARSMKGDVYQRKVLMLGFELGELDSKGRPFHMTKLVTLSLNTQATLYTIVKSLHGDLSEGDRFNPGMLANKPCLLQISHDRKEKKGKERVYANIDSVGRPPRGLVTPPGDCVVWRISDHGLVPFPDLGHLPPVWNEVVGKMWTVHEWAAGSAELHAAKAASPQFKPAHELDDDELPY